MIAALQGGAEEQQASFSDNANVDTSAGGSGYRPAINLMKYAAGDMNQRLEGAVFELYYQRDDQPVLDKDGNPVTFTTNEEGMIHVEGSTKDYGWDLVEDAGYYLEEVEAPEGYKLSDFKYLFTISGTPDYDNYVFYFNDTMTAKNYPGIDIPVSKEWSDGNENHETDSVTVQLQQSIAGGDWEDVSGKTLTLNKDNEWKAVFAGLDLVNENDQAVTYQVKELSVDGYESKITGSMEDGFVITNTKEGGEQETSVKISKVAAGAGNELAGDEGRPD